MNKKVRKKREDRNTRASFYLLHEQVKIKDGRKGDTPIKRSDGLFVIGSN